jgi:hypothetical protein
LHSVCFAMPDGKSLLQRRPWLHCVGIAGTNPAQPGAVLPGPER